MQEVRTSADLATGYCRVGSRDLFVTLRRCGEGLELANFERPANAAFAEAADRDTLAAVFSAPRVGADRYGDWAEFEWNMRMGMWQGTSSRVWRIAEDRDWATFLGQSSRRGDAVFPVGAAIWRGWDRLQKSTPRALYWQGRVRSHCWIVRPFQKPEYITTAGESTPEALVVALTRYGDPRHMAVELGGTSTEFRRQLAHIHPGPIRSVEPFAELQIAAPLRDTVIEMTDPSEYLPAVGAARSLLDGPPPPL